MAEQGGGRVGGSHGGSSSSSSMVMRDYRKGNWTVQETMILIEAKKTDDERRKIGRKQQAAASHSGSGDQQQSNMMMMMIRSNKPVTELRWKWVEEYCWKKGCYRSQNQCNDKWDNLMRDYKKVREYQKNTNTNTNNNDSKSYWNMDKGERKDKGLPTNMLPQIYQALFEVVDQRPPSSTPPVSSSHSPSPSPTPTSAPVQMPPPPQPATLHLPPPLPPPPPPLHPPPPPPPTFTYFSHPHPSTTSDSETSEPSHSESPAKRRKKGEGGHGGAGEGDGGGEGTSGRDTHDMAATAAAGISATPTSSTARHLLSTAISTSATVIAEAIKASEEREEKRHREIVSLHETRLRLEQSRMEVHRQGFNGLADAINKLATSILTWANSHTHQPPP